MPRERHQKGLQNARGFLNNPKLQDALAELEDNPDALGEAKRDPQGFLKNRGVEVPGNPSRVVIEEGSIRIGICWFDWCLWVEF